MSSFDEYLFLPVTLAARAKGLTVTVHNGGYRRN
jgi:hypothetical protein